jgi:hypothetical protein
VHLWWGIWARFWPRDFFDEFPGFGHRWTAAYPPFNEHLVTDLGSTFITLAFLLAVGAAIDDRRLRLVVVSAVLLFSVSHLAFHLGHRGSMAAFDLGASLATLAAGAAAPVALLAIDILGQHRGGAGLPARQGADGGTARPGHR